MLNMFFWSWPDYSTEAKIRAIETKLQLMQEGKDSGISYVSMATSASGPASTARPSSYKLSSSSSSYNRQSKPYSKPKGYR